MHFCQKLRTTPTEQHQQMKCKFYGLAVAVIQPIHQKQVAMQKQKILIYVSRFSVFQSAHSRLFFASSMRMYFTLFLFVHAFIRLLIVLRRIEQWDA